MSTETTPAAVSKPGRQPSNRSAILAVTRFELLRHFRRRRFFVLLAIVALFVSLLIVVQQLFGSATGSVYSYTSLFGIWVTIVAALAATFFGADAIVGEFENRTGYVVFPQPVTRTSIFVGKFLAAFLLTALVMAGYYDVVAVATWIVKGSVPIEITYSFLLAVLYSTSALAVAFFLSSTLRGTTMASIMTFALLFFILPILDTVVSVAQVRPDGSLAFAGGTIGNMLSGPYPSGYPGDSTVPAGPGGATFTVYSPGVLISTLVMGIWAIAPFVLAWALFGRREMKG